jgi:hypothetical protein
VGFLDEPVTAQLLAVGMLMALGVWLHLPEHHEHEHTHEPIEHAHPHVHDEQSTPFLSIAERLVFTVRGEHKAHWRPEPYSIEHKKDV